MNKVTSFLAFVVVSALFALTVLAHKHGFYDRFWWYDNMMHTLGGVFLAFLGYRVLARYSQSTEFSHITRTVILFVFCVGVFWEAYEYAVQLAFPFEHIASPLDSLQDLALDMVGGVLGISFVSLIKKRYTTENGS